MRRKSILKILLLSFSATAAMPAFSQVVPAAEEGRLPISVGGGLSNFNVDWGHNNMDGGTLWLDYNANILVKGLGFELEVRDISRDRGTNPPNFREDAADVGYIYRWPHYRNFRPYAKYLVGLGSVDYAVPGDPNLSHANRINAMLGGGMNYRVYRHVWIRADYEFQAWARFVDYSGNTIHLTPKGVTIGAMYDFARFYHR